MGLRESILASTDLPREPVKAWGQTVWVRTLSGAEKDAFEDQSVVAAGQGMRAVRANFRARLAALVCCDADGKRLFTDADAQALGQTSACELEKIVKVAARLNGMTPDALEKAEKNSEHAHNGASAFA